MRIAWLTRMASGDRARDLGARQNGSWRAVASDQVLIFPGAMHLLASWRDRKYGF